MKTGKLLGLFGSLVLVVGCAQSDAGITTSVKSKLVADDLVKARQINVDTQNRVVTLTGNVQSPAEETQALQIARNTKGVSNVVDNITVQGMEQGSAATSGTEVTSAPSPSSSAPMASATDSDLTTQVKSALMADRSLNGQAITVDAKGGVVTLTGTVASAADKTKAADIAGKVANVTSVDNQVIVK